MEAVASDINGLTVPHDQPSSAKTPPWRVPFAALEETPGRLRGIVDEWGCAVVSGVATPGECAQWATDIAGFFEALGTGVRITPGDKRQNEGDVARECPRSRWMVNNGGLCHNFGCGHLPPVWDARCHPRVRRVFAEIWGTDELACSFDGVNVDRPKLNPSRQAPKLGLHTDQDPASNPAGLRCVQGVLSLTRTVTACSGTSLVPGSHRYHREMLLERFPTPAKEFKRDWIVLPDPALNWLLARPGCNIVHVETSAGDMVLWDSRTIHCGRRVRATGMRWEARRPMNTGLLFCSFPLHFLESSCVCVLDPLTAAPTNLAVGR